MAETETSDIRLNSPIEELSGVGKRRAEMLRRLEIRYVVDLLRHLPMRYQFESAQTTIQQLQVDSIGTAVGMIAAARWVPSGRGRGRFEATLQDDSGTLKLTWFNAGYLRNKLHPGEMIRVQGKVGRFGEYLQMSNPKWQIVWR